MRPAVLLIAVTALGVGWWLGRSGSGVQDEPARVAVVRSATVQGLQGPTGPVRVGEGQAEPSGCAPAGGRPSARAAAGAQMPGKDAGDRSAVAQDALGRSAVPTGTAASPTGKGPAVAAANGRPGDGRPQGADYQPEPVRQGLDLQPQLGVRIRSGGDMAFSFDPQAYRDGAMHLINEVGRPVVVTFYGPGCSELRVNGQPISEGRAYLVGAEAVVRGSQAVGIEVRKPTGAEGEPLPNGAG